MTLLVDSLELWAPSSGYAFEIVGGGLSDIPAFRGDNVTIPQKDGQTYMPKVADSMTVTLYGIVMGEANGSTAPESYRSRMDSLRAILDPTNGQFTITVASPFEGLSSGEQATITVEFERWVVVREGLYFREGKIECLCISDPPGWTVTAGS